MEVEAVLHSLSVKSRDNARTPMQWDDTLPRWLHRGDSLAAGQPQLRHDQRRRRELADPDSVFHHFRKLIELRHDHPVIVAWPVRAAASRP